MTDDTILPVPVAKSVVALATSAMGPVGAVMDAIFNHNQEQWNKVSERNFVEFVYETFSDHKDHIQGADEEFDRVRRMVEWLSDEMEAMSQRLGNVEAFAMGQIMSSSLATMHGIWSKNSDPEMAVHLQAAFRSLTTRRDQFRGSVADSMVQALSGVRSDHIEALKIIHDDEHTIGGVRAKTFESGLGKYRDPILQVLNKMALVNTGKLMFKNGISSYKWITPLGSDFLRFIELASD